MLPLILLNGPTPSILLFLFTSLTKTLIYLELTNIVKSQGLHIQITRTAHSNHKDCTFKSQGLHILVGEIPNAFVYFVFTCLLARWRFHSV